MPSPAAVCPMATIIDGEREAGLRAPAWPAGGLASRVPLVRLEAGSSRSVQRMLLVR